jgi:hypothetical protein
VTNPPVASLVPQLPGVGYGNRGPEAWGAQIASCCPLPSAATASTGPCGCPPLPNYFIVDQAYTGTDGDGTAGRPFRTIAEAFSALTQDYSTVLVYPGEYPELLTIPGSINGFALIGSGRGNTIISQPSTSPTITYAPADDTIVRAQISNLRIENTSLSGQALSVSGAAVSPSNAFSAGLFLENLDLVSNVAGGNTSAAITTVGRLSIVNCSFENGAVLTNIGQGAILGTLFNDDLTVRFLDASAQPTAGRLELIIGGGSRVLGQLSLIGHPWLTADASVAVGSILGPTLDLSASNLPPNLLFAGQVGSELAAGPVLLLLPSSAVAPSNISFHGARVFGSLAITSPAGTVQPIDLAGSLLSGPLVLTGPGQMQIDFRRSSCLVTPAFLFFPGDGHTVDRDRVVLRNIDVPLNAPNVYAFASTNGGTSPTLLTEPLFPAGAEFSIAFGQRSIPTAFTEIVTLAAYTPADFTLGPVSALQQTDVTLTRATV